MRYHDLPRLYTPVTAAPPRRQRATSPVAIPESGGRWGGPSAFSWSGGPEVKQTEQRVVNKTPPGAPRDYMRIHAAQARVVSQRVRVESPADPSVYIEIDRLTRMLFHYTEFPPKSNPAGLTPTRTTYFDLSFDLHPAASEEA